MDELQVTVIDQLHTRTQVVACSSEFEEAIQKLGLGIDVIVPAGTIIAAAMGVPALMGQLNIPLKANTDYENAKRMRRDMCSSERTETYESHERWFFRREVADEAWDAWIECLRLCPTTMHSSLEVIDDLNARYCAVVNPGVRARVSSMFVVGGRCQSTKQEQCFVRKVELCTSVPPEDQSACILRKQRPCRRAAGKLPFRILKDVETCLHCTRDEVSSTVAVNVDTSVGGSLESWAGATPTPTITPTPNAPCLTPRPVEHIGTASGNGYVQAQSSEAVTYFYPGDPPLDAVCIQQVIPRSPYTRWVNATGGDGINQNYNFSGQTIYFGDGVNLKAHYCECNTYSSGDLGCGRSQPYCDVYGWFE